MPEEKYKKFYKDLPKTPGVYIFKDGDGDILYIGKAAHLKKRVRSYFTGAHERRTEELIKRLEDIEARETDSALEALILEANLIKKHQPPFNVREKDDKSFLWVRIMDTEEFPRVLLARGTTKKATKDRGSWFGPFTSASDIRNALKMLRKIFPYNTHKPSKVGAESRECMYAQIGLCPGTCVGSADKAEYKETMEGLKKVLSGKRLELIDDLKEKMDEASENQEYERANKYKKQIFSLKHIQDVGFISESLIRNTQHGLRDRRIEGYDISQISGTSSVGVMVAFKDGKPNKSQYRKFKIKTIEQQDDVGMMREVLERRFSHEEWPFPDLVVVDGGKGQVNTAVDVLGEVGLEIPVVGIAKGPKRDKNEIIGEIPENFNKKILLQVRDEAHRFAQKYHKSLREKRSLGR